MDKRRSMASIKTTPSSSGAASTSSSFPATPTTPLSLESPFAPTTATPSIAGSTPITPTTPLAAPFDPSTIEAPLEPLAPPFDSSTPETPPEPLYPPFDPSAPSTSSTSGQSGPIDLEIHALQTRAKLMEVYGPVENFMKHHTDRRHDFLPFLSPGGYDDLNGAIENISNLLEANRERQKDEVYRIRRKEVENEMMFEEEKEIYQEWIERKKNHQNENSVSPVMELAPDVSQKVLDFFAEQNEENGNNNDDDGNIV